MQSQFNFQELIDRYHIQVPIIQRDYVQGSDKNRDKRDKFLKVIFQVLNINSEVGGINLDFIYGKVENDVFIPIDGQQRLTTLFVLHLFNPNRKNLDKFTYETRSTTMEFLRNLILVSIENLNSNHIKNQQWYFNEYGHDTNIQSMLNLIDKICELKSENTQFENLKNIYFSVLFMDEFELNDELYIKMNARGKHLDDFENLKSQIESEFDSGKFDNEWYEKFWDCFYDDKTKCEKIAKETDELFFKFLKNYAINVLIFNKKLEKFDLELNEIKEVLLDNSDEISAILDNLDAKEIKPILLNLDYDNRARLFAYCEFYAKSSDKNGLENYMSVVNSVIDNVYTDSMDDFRKMLVFIDELSVENTIKWVFDKWQPSKDGNNGIASINFAKANEYEKAKIICQDLAPKSVIDSINSHWYLKGRVIFLLEIIGFDYSKLELVFDKFNDKFPKENDDRVAQVAFQISLLNYGDYTKKDGNYSYFCNFDKSIRQKSESWFKVFADKDKRQLFRNFLFDGSLAPIGWQDGFIKYPEILSDYCRNLWIYNKDGVIHILTKFQRNANQYEYLTLQLFLKLKRQNPNMQYPPKAGLTNIFGFELNLASFLLVMIAEKHLSIFLKKIPNKLKFPKTIFCIF